MKFTQLGLSEYNNAILEIYGANPVKGLKGAVKQPEPEDENTDVKPQTKLVSSGLLAKETLRLRNTAVLNLKHTEMVFRYEKRRFKELEVQLKGLTSKKKSAKEVEEEEREEKKDKDKFEFPNLGKLLKRLLKKLWRKLVPKRIRSRMRRFRMRLKRGLRSLKRRIKVPLKRAWRKITRPFRQTKRFVKSKTTKVKDFFKKKGRRLKRNLKISTGRKFQQAQRFAANKFAQAKTGARGLFDRAKKFGTSKLDDLKKLRTQKVKQAGGFFGNLVQRGKKIGLAGIELAKKGSTKLGNIFNTLKNPETYKKVTSSLKKHIGTPIQKLKGAARGVVDDILQFLYKTPLVQKILKSAIGKRLLTKIGAKGGAKLLGKLIPGVGVIIGLADAIYRGTQGDWEGVLISALGAIPVVGWAAIALDLYRELDPEGYTKYVRQGMSKEDMNRVLEGVTVESFATAGEGIAAGAGGMSMSGFSQGGKVSGPQLVLVGEGGEDEWIIPKSKLEYFLGSDAALNLMNFGAGSVYSSVNQYLNDIGLTNLLPEASEGKNLEGADQTIDTNLQKLRKISFGDKIVNFVKDVFENIIDIFKGPWEKLKSLWKSLSSGVGNFVSGAANALFGGAANAATIGPSILSGSAAGTFNTGLKTGKSAYIGGSSDYHIDTKFRSTLSMEEKVKMMDQLAAGYAAQGRNIEFSNSMIQNVIYNPNASFEEKSALLQKAFEAHNLPRGRAIDQGGFNSIDYYAPLIGENRFGSSVEGQDILIPKVEGGKVTYSQGGGYGAFVTLTDEKGNVILKTGHGDIRGAKTGSVSIPKAPPINKPEITEEPAEYNFIGELSQMITTQQSPQNPLVVPVPIPSSGKDSGLGMNSPAWGLNSVFGN